MRIECGVDSLYSMSCRVGVFEAEKKDDDGRFATEKSVVQQGFYDILSEKG
jgi:hypothetical protein